MELWIVGKATGEMPDGGIVWEIQGVYDSEDKAVAECRTPLYFVGPQLLNVGRPHEREVWAGSYYPLADEIAEWAEEDLARGSRS